MVINPHAYMRKNIYATLIFWYKQYINQTPVWLDTSKLILATCVINIDQYYTNIFIERPILRVEDA